MPIRLQIPKEVLLLFPDYSVGEIRSVIEVIHKARRNRLRQADIFKVRLPGIGTLRSRGNKRPKRRQSVLQKDRERKRLQKVTKDKK